MYDSITLYMMFHVMYETFCICYRPVVEAHQVQDQPRLSLVKACINPNLCHFLQVVLTASHSHVDVVSSILFICPTTQGLQ